jgi:beta-N-acetylhexosaminidase
MRRSAAAALLAALALAACAGGPGPRALSSPSPRAVSRATAMPSPPPTPDPLAGLTPAQRVAQLIMVGFVGPALDADLRKAFSSYRFGAVVVDNGNDNLQSQTQVKQLVASIRSAEGPGPGPIVTTNQEGGTVCFAGSGMACPAGQREEGASGDPQRIAADTTSMAQGLRGLDLNSGLAPVADVWDGASPFMADRSYGSDPESVSRLVTAAIDADHAQHVMAVAKHFPGHGSASDSHVSLPTVNRDIGTIQRVDLPPFQAAIWNGVDMVMVAHLLVAAIDPSLPTSLSPRAMGLLRTQLGYGGVIITDDLMMGAIRGAYQGPQAAVMALRAGADMVMFAGSVELAEQAVQKVLDAVASGQIPQAQIDRSARRVLALKARYGLLGPPTPTPS